MNILIKLFSLKGRISRGTYFRLSLLYSLIALVSAYVFVVFASKDTLGIGFAIGLLGLIITGAGFWSMFVRRFHDICPTKGQLIGTILLAIVNLIFIKLVVDKSLYTEFSSSADLAVKLTSALYGAIVLFGVKGTTGPNPYGEDPLDISAVDSGESSNTVASTV